MKNAYQELSAVIPGYPGTRIMHFVDRETPLIAPLQEATKACEGEYQIQCLTDESCGTLTRRFALTSAIKVRPVSWGQPRYHIQAKLYDFVFVEAPVPNPQHFLKTIYTAMKNAANIFILLPSEHKGEIETWRQYMEANFYVAFSTFALDDQTQIIAAKKMHGWGG